MARQVRANQLLDGKSWDGFTHRNHLFTAMADNPIERTSVIEDVLDYNMGEDFVSMVEKHSVHELESDSEGRYEWDLMYMPDAVYICRGAYYDEDGAEPILDTDQVGINYTRWFMDFEGDVFQDTEIIEGPNPNTDLAYVRRRWNVSGDTFRYEMEIPNAINEEDSLDGTAVLAGSKWTEATGAVSKYLSDRGVDIAFRTPVKARNELSSFRLQHTIAGHMQKYKPKYFYFKDENGKLNDKNFYWMTVVEYELMRKYRKMRAHAIMYGKGNRNPNTGRVALKNDAGYEIEIGSGWEEQFRSSNRRYWTGAPDLDELSGIIGDVVYGEEGTMQREAIIKGGEQGLNTLSNAITAKYGAAANLAPWMGDTSGRAYAWKGDNDLVVKTGQVTGIYLLGNIKLKFVVDSSKDGGRNQAEMPGLHGKVASYQYDIIGLGGKDAESNLKIVRRKGETYTVGVMEGIRSPYTGAGTMNNPNKISSAVDASTLHLFEPGVGAMVKDPTRIIQYWPDVLPYDR